MAFLTSEKYRVIRESKTDSLLIALVLWGGIIVYLVIL